MSADGEEIAIPMEIPARDVSIDDLGIFRYVDEFGAMIDLGYQLGIYQFSNPQGLEAIGSNLFRETIASGAPLSEFEGETSNFSRIIQGYLENQPEALGGSPWKSQA
jgi:flagellar basal-body rod protein FlgG